MLFSTSLIVVFAALSCAAPQGRLARFYAKRSNLNGELDVYARRLAYRSQPSELPPEDWHKVCVITFLPQNRAEFRIYIYQLDFSGYENKEADDAHRWAMLYREKNLPTINDSESPSPLQSRPGSPEPHSPFFSHSPEPVLPAPVPPTPSHSGDSSKPVLRWLHQFTLI